MKFERLRNHVRNISRKQETPTEKQLEFISDIEEFCGVRFCETSKQDATDFISKNIGLFSLYATSDKALKEGCF